MTDLDDRYSYLFLNAYINRHAHTGRFTWVLLHTFIVFLVSCWCLCFVSLPRCAVSRSMICDCCIFERKIRQSLKPITVISAITAFKIFIWEGIWSDIRLGILVSAVSSQI